MTLSSGQYRVIVDDSVFDVKLGEGNSVFIDGVPVDLKLVSSSNGTLRMFLENAFYEIDLLENSRNNALTPWNISVNGHSLSIEIKDHKTLLRESLRGVQTKSSARHDIRAPMPGKVVRIEAQEGETVQAGGGIVVLEAMKMENEIRTPVRGRIEKILVASGRAVEKGELLVSLTPL